MATTGQVRAGAGEEALLHATASMALMLRWRTAEGGEHRKRRRPCRGTGPSPDLTFRLLLSAGDVEGDLHVGVLLLKDDIAAGEVLKID